MTDVIKLLWAPFISPSVSLESLDPVILTGCLLGGRGRGCLTRLLRRCGTCSCSWISLLFLVDWHILCLFAAICLDCCLKRGSAVFRFGTFDVASNTGHSFCAWHRSHGECTETIRPVEKCFASCAAFGTRSAGEAQRLLSSHFWTCTTEFAGAFFLNTGAGHPFYFNV